jgi:hypothetical protein
LYASIDKMRIKILYNFLQIARGSMPRMPQVAARTAVHALNFHRKIEVRAASAEVRCDNIDYRA